MPTLLQSILNNGQPSAAAAVVIPAESGPSITVSKSELINAIRNAQKDLADLRIQLGSVVALSIPNSYEFTVLFLAIASQRAVAAPLNPAFRQPEFEYFLDDLQPAAIIVPSGATDKKDAAVLASAKNQVPTIEVRRDGTNIRLVVKSGSLPAAKSTGPAEADADDVALVLHTSGTTGRPKSVPLTHANITKTMSNIKATYLLSPDDRSLLVMPLFHIHGLVAGLLSPLGSGGSVIIPPRFSASTFWDHFVTHGATWYTAVPTIHQILLNGLVPNPLPQIRFIRSCSSPLAPVVFHALERTFKTPVLEAYAMTEAAHQMASNPLPPADRFPGSVGIPQGVEIRILKPFFDGDDPKSMDETALPPNTEGEVCTRGSNVTKGYANNAAANATAFTPHHRFFRTGDSGKVNENGYLILTGRLKEMINRGGEKISPIEIDNTVSQHPAVSEVTAFAVPDELYGQVVGIAVVKREKADLTGTELREWLKSRLASFKVPERIYFTAVMPKTATGKIQRRVVASAMLAKSAEESARDGDDIATGRKGPVKAKL